MNFGSNSSVFLTVIEFWFCVWWNITPNFSTLIFSCTIDHLGNSNFHRWSFQNGLISWRLRLSRNLLPMIQIGITSELVSSFYFHFHAIIWAKRRNKPIFYNSNLQLHLLGKYTWEVVLVLEHYRGSMADGREMEALHHISAKAVVELLAISFNNWKPWKSSIWIPRGEFQFSFIF